MAPPCMGQTVLMEFLLPYASVNEIKDSGTFRGCRFGHRVFSFLEEIFQVNLDSPLACTTGPKVWTQICVVGDFSCTVRTFLELNRKSEMLVTLTLECPDGVTGLADSLNAFRAEMLRMLNPTPDVAPDQQTALLFPAIRRGEEVNSYYFCLGRLAEYDIVGCPYDRRSRYQHIQIRETGEFGNALFIDDDVQLAETDCSTYTHTLMNMPQEESGYKDADILILGSGDGNLLHELLQLKNPPKHVTMVDLDEAVLIGCAEHMKTLCGDYLVRRKGDNFEILIEDAVAFMQKQIEAGKKYDYVFSDLVEMPVFATGGQLCHHQITNLAINLVKPDVGKLMSHCGKPAVEMLESFLNCLKLDSDPSYRAVYQRRECLVPSFMGIWVFFCIQMRKE